MFLPIWVCNLNSLIRSTNTGQRRVYKEPAGREEKSFKGKKGLVQPIYHSRKKNYDRESFLYGGLSVNGVAWGWMRRREHKKKNGDGVARARNVTCNPIGTAGAVKRSGGRPGREIRSAVLMMERGVSPYRRKGGS